MKIYFNKPKDNWLSPLTIIEKMFFWREIDYDEPIIEFWNGILSPFCSVLFDIRQFFNRDIRYVKIDPWDTWSMDSTLSPIILPMLKQLKATKHGAPHIDDEDVPVKLRANRDTRYQGTVDSDIHKINDEVDKKFFKRFDYILDEMIWTFEQLSDWNNDAKFFDHSRANNSKDSLDKQVGKIKIDRVGLKKHNDRIDNGLRLFGKYFRTLWD